MKTINFSHKITLLPACIFVVLVWSSCTKLIEIPINPSNQLSRERVFADSANIIGAVSAVYDNFGLSTYDPQFGSGLMTVLTGLTSDELLPGADIYTAPAFYNNSILPDNFRVAEIWADAYRNIFQINICLEGIAGTNAISPQLKRQLIAELKVDRAFYYYNMVIIWGAVPIITSTDFNTTRNTPRSPMAEVFSFIVADLKDASQNLTVNYPSADRARPNLYVAQALLSKVYLYLGQYQDAITQASSVIGSEAYMLEEDLNAVFLKGSSEAIWQLPANGNGGAGQTQEALTFIPYDDQVQPSYVVSDQLLNAFEMGDLRKSSWLSSNTVSVGGIDTYYFYPYKYKQIDAGQGPLEGYMILRLADIYLVRAEALAQTDKISEALTDLNAIRGRTSLGDLHTDSKNTALDAVLHERRIELFCEWGNRWIDLKRTHTIDAVLGASKPGWKPSAALFPVPIVEIQANPALKN